MQEDLEICPNTFSVISIDLVADTSYGKVEGGR